MTWSPWSVEWSRAADADVLRMHWQEATHATRAVYRLAEGGGGTVERTEEAGLYRLRASRSTVLFRRDRPTRTIYVLRIFGP